MQAGQAFIKKQATDKKTRVDGRPSGPRGPGNKLVLIGGAARPPAY